MKKLLFVFPVIVLLAAGCAGQQVDNQSSTVPSMSPTYISGATSSVPTITPSPTAMPTQAVTPTPTAQAGANIYNGATFTFQYPSNYQVDAQTQQVGIGALKTIVSLTENGTPTVLNPANSPSGAKIYVSTDNKAFSVSRISQDYVVNGTPSPTIQTLGSNTWYDFSGGGGGVNYPDNFYYNLKGKLIQVSFWGPYTGQSNHPDAASTEQLILSTFASK